MAAAILRTLVRIFEFARGSWLFDRSDQGNPNLPQVGFSEEITTHLGAIDWISSREQHTSVAS